MLENMNNTADLSSVEVKIFTEQEKQSLFENAIDMVFEAGKITNTYFKQNLLLRIKPRILSILLQLQISRLKKK